MQRYYCRLDTRHCSLSDPAPPDPRTFLLIYSTELAFLLHRHGGRARGETVLCVEARDRHRESTRESARDLSAREAPLPQPQRRAVAYLASANVPQMDIAARRGEPSQGPASRRRRISRLSRRARRRRGAAAAAAARGGRRGAPRARRRREGQCRWQRAAGARGRCLVGVRVLGIG